MFADVEPEGEVVEALVNGATEDHHQAVAQVLHLLAAVGGDRLAQQSEVRPPELLRPFLPQPLQSLGRADEVGEEERGRPRGHPCRSLPPRARTAHRAARARLFYTVMQGPRPNNRPVWKVHSAPVEASRSVADGLPRAAARGQTERPAPPKRRPQTAVIAEPSHWLPDVRRRPTTGRALRCTGQAHSGLNGLSMRGEIPMT